MPKVLIKVDLTKSPNEQPVPFHNRWHPDIPPVVTVKPGAVFRVECYDWTGGQIENDDSANDIRDVELPQVHYLSGPIAVEGAEPGDILVVDIVDIGALPNAPWGFTGIFARRTAAASLPTTTPRPGRHLGPSTGIYAMSRHIPGVRFAGLTHPGSSVARRPQDLLDVEQARGRADCHQPEPRPAAGARRRRRSHAVLGTLARRRLRSCGARGRHAPSRRASTAATATSRTCRAARGSTSRSTSAARTSRWATSTSRRATARSPSAAPSRWRATWTSHVDLIKGGMNKYGVTQPHLPAGPGRAALLRVSSSSRDLRRRARQAVLPRRPRRLPARVPERHRVPEEVRLHR